MTEDQELKLLRTVDNLTTELEILKIWVYALGVDHTRIGCPIEAIKKSPLISQVEKEILIDKLISLQAKSFRKFNQ